MDIYPNQRFPLCSGFYFNFYIILYNWFVAIRSPSLHIRTMASKTLTTTITTTGCGTVKLNSSSSSSSSSATELAGFWENHKKFDLTPIIGTVFDDVSLPEILHSPDCDALIRELAILVSYRGVCVFPKQSALSIPDQKLLCRKLGQLTTRPETSDLWIHPVNQTVLPDGTLDGEYMSPSRDPSKKLYTQVIMD